MRKLISLFLILLSANVFGQAKISQLPSVTSLSGTELVPVVQGGITKQATTAQLQAISIQTLSRSGQTLSLTSGGSVTVQPPLNGTGFVKTTGTVVTYDNSTYAPTSSLSLYVPYSGATGSVNLGANNFSVGLTSTLTNAQIVGTVNITSSVNIGAATDNPTAFGILRVCKSSGNGTVDIGGLGSGYGSIHLSQASPTGNNYAIAGGGTDLLVNSPTDSSSISFSRGNSSNMLILRGKQTNNTNSAFVINNPNRLNITAGSLSPNVDVIFNGSQYKTGAITTQYAMRLQSPAYYAVGASTMTNCYTHFASKATASTNLSITNLWGYGTDGSAHITQSVVIGTTARTPVANLDVTGTMSVSSTATIAGALSVTNGSVLGTTSANFLLLDNSIGAKLAYNSNNNWNVGNQSASLLLNGATIQSWGTSGSALTGSLSVSARLKESQGAAVASANNLTLGSDGNSFEITGTTQINLISNTSWQDGSVIRLLFTSTPTVKNGQTTSGSNITIKLAGGVDFAATADDVLTLVLSTVGGVQAWREVSRSIN